MSAITGAISVQLGELTCAPPAPPHTYLGVARQLLPGVQALAGVTPSPSMPMMLLAAHTLECALKAYLSRSGSDAALKNKQVRHNLKRLWELAEADGLGIPRLPPYWVDRLHHLHDAPYYLRYSTGVNGLVGPGAEPMTTELAQLLEQVGAGLGSP